MPIEAGSPSAATDDSSVGAACLAECRATLDTALKKIEHCLDQLSDADLNWRQHASHNSIQTVLLHLCGNLRQWILYITRLRLGDAYRFQWTPASPEQGGPV